MRANTLSDISAELSTRDDPFLVDVAHLVLELGSNEKVAAMIDLVSREATFGVWDCNQTLVM
jgi:hypothetical protein